MPAPRFVLLFARYPEIIALMRPEFTSHEFILRLAQRNQADYIEALHSFGSDEPFRKVHAQLSQQLQKHPALVTQLADDPSSPNIFGEPQICARWQRVA